MLGTRKKKKKLANMPSFDQTKSLLYEPTTHNFFIFFNNTISLDMQ